MAFAINYIRENITKLRWGLLLLFAIGYAVTAMRFDNAASEYLVYNLLAFGVCAVLLTQLRAFEQRYAAVWLGLIIIVTVYFLRFYWIVIDPSPLKIMLRPPVYKAMIQNEALFQAFKLSVMAFAVFSLFAAAMLFLLRQEGAMKSQDEANADTASYWLIAKLSLLVLPPLLLVLAYIAHKYHIGEMGTASGEPLPFRLKGVVFYARIILVPMMILLLIYSAERSGHAVVARLGILLLLSHGVIDMFIRNSRSSLLLCVLLLVFLVMAGGLKLRRNEKILVGITIVLALIMVPILSAYRAGRTAHGLPPIDALIVAVKVALQNGGGEWWRVFMDGLVFALFRMPGIEGVAAMIGLGAEPLGMQSIDVIGSELGLSGYLTHDIYQISIEQKNHSTAPGFVGWFYLVAGIPAIVLGAVTAAILTVFGWRFLSPTYLVCAPVAQAFLLWMLFIALTEGTLDSMVYMVLVGIVCILAFESSLRLIKKVFCGSGLRADRA